MVKMNNEQTQSNKLEEYIILPGRCHDDYEYQDTLVSINLEEAKNWYDAHMKAQNKGNFVLTPRQYIDFLVMLIDSQKRFRPRVFLGNGKKLRKEAIEEIIKKHVFRDKVFAEALDARFMANHESKTYMLFNHKLNDGFLAPMDVAEVDLLLDRHFGDNYHYLRKFNKCGLPIRGGFADTSDKLRYNNRRTIEVILPRSYDYPRLLNKGTVACVFGSCNLSLHYDGFEGEMLFRPCKRMTD